MPKKLKTIQVANTKIDIYDGDIGINCSGGADSTMLLYQLLKHTNGTIHVFTLGNNERGRHSVKVAVDVIEKCIKLTGNSNIQHHIAFADGMIPPLQGVDFYLENGIIEILYTGITANPPKKVTNKFRLPVVELQRNGKSELINHDGKIYDPFTNVDKREIAKMYDEELLKDLFAITRSCEYDPLSSLFDDVEDPGRGHCGECWWCEERQWAFGRLE